MEVVSLGKTKSVPDVCRCWWCRATLGPFGAMQAQFAVIVAALMKE